MCYTRTKPACKFPPGMTNTGSSEEAYPPATPEQFSVQVHLCLKTCNVCEGIRVSVQLRGAWIGRESACSLVVKVSSRGDTY